RDVQIARRVAVEADSTAEPDFAAPDRRRHVIEPDAAGVEPDGPVDCVERIRRREMPDPSVAERCVAGEHRLPQRTVDRCGELGASGAANASGEESLKNAEVRVAVHLQRDAIVAERDRAADAEPRVFADELQLLDAY